MGSVVMPSWMVIVFSILFYIFAIIFTIYYIFTFFKMANNVKTIRKILEREFGDLDEHELKKK